MSFDPVYQTENFTALITVKSAQTVVECRFAQAEEPGEILVCRAEVSSDSCEPSDGRVNFGGKVVCTVVYKGESGLCRMQKGVEFNYHVDDDRFASAQTALCRMQVIKTQLKREGSATVVSAIVEAEISVYGRQERTYLTDVGDIVCLKRDVNLYTAQPFYGEGEVEDFFDAEGVTDVLLHSACATVSSCVCRGGDAEVKGEISLSVLALKSGAPLTVERSVPFTVLVPCDGALAEQKCSATVVVKSCSVTARVSEERQKCELEVVANVGASGVCLIPVETPVVEDAFFPNHKIALKTVQEKFALCQTVHSFQERIHAPCAVKAKLNFDHVLKSVTPPSVEFSLEEDTLQGAVVSTLLYEREGELYATEVSLPFSTTLPCVGLQNVVVTACGMVVKQEKEGECTAEATLKICGIEEEEVSQSYVCDVHQGEAEALSQAAVSVFIPGQGDDLWAVAKKLKQQPEQVKSCNPDLTFPLSGKERIVVYRQKLN